MEAFEYAKPATTDEAVKLLASSWGETEVLAGGTDLLSLMKDNGTAPKRLVSLSGISALKGISAQAGGLRIGSMTTLQELIASPAVGKQYPALVEAAHGVRSPQFRDGHRGRRPAATALLVHCGGHGLSPHTASRSTPTANQYRHLGNSGPAYFLNPSSFAPVLIARREGEAPRPNGDREIELNEFFRSPATPTEREYDEAQ
jgi:CO/xanthine dehydrogenase FAD-binding subunit